MRRLVPGPALVLMLTACGAAPPPPRGAAEQQDTLLGPGHALYWSGSYDSARVVWGETLVRARVAGDSIGMANLMTWLGLAAMRSGDFDEARQLGEAALEIRVGLGSREGRARSYNALGLLAQAEDRLHDARLLYWNARDAAAAAGEKDVEVAAAGNLGLVHAYLGDLAAAADVFEEMRRAARSLPDERLEANALTNLAMVRIWAGDPGAAVGPLDTARALYGKLGYALGEQIALGQLATARAAMGEYESALTALDGALALARRHGMRDEEAENLGLLGTLYAELGDSRRALRHLDEAAAVASELEYGYELGSALRRSALVRQSLGWTDRALSDARGALAAHRASGYALEELDDLIVLAALHRRAGDAAQADSMLRSADVLAQQLDVRSARAAVALAEARHAELDARPRLVLEAVARAQPETLAGDFQARTESHMLAARAYARLERLDSAAIEGRAALSALERVRGRLASDELRGSLAAASANLYGDVVLILLQLDRIEEAFGVADAARSRELLQRLAGARAAAADGRVEDPVLASQDLAESELLLRRIDALLAQLKDLEAVQPRERSVGSTATSSEIVERIDSLRQEYEVLTIRAARRHPRSTGILGVVRTEESAVRAALAADEALVHYTLTPDELVIFVARADRFESLRLPVGAADVASRIRLLREIWSDRTAGPAAGVPAARGLHEILIAPIARAGLLEGVERLVVVPHGVLEHLPFAGLQDPATGRFLVEDYFITYLRSANLLPALRATVARPAAATDGLAAFAPYPSALPGTRAEATEARRSESRGSLRLGNRATEGAVRRALMESRIVHIASHGVLNARNPMFSRIELAPGPGRSSADDGRLEVHEVLKLSLNSQLVVLSGCETAAAEDWSGDPLRPAGVATLGQAFLHAGARNVMATLWRIDDTGSANLVSRFYRSLDGGDVAGSLARAQRALISDGAHSAPYYWAGFVLTGEGHIASSLY
jgi:CHAT domain-containing protein/tetratricopeptide (TPR) repeat protein